MVLALVVGVLCVWGRLSVANPEAKRLYDDLLSNYNRLIRPVGNNSDRLTVKMGLRLSQLIDVNLKNQIMTTNVWVEQEWNDYKLKWNPDDYGGVETLHVPSEHIWLPDIVLYNNADGNYEVTIMTKAILHHDGKVIWKPPAIYKSFCEIDVEYFPFDEQTCFMKFGSWSYDGYTVDLRHLKQTPDSDHIGMGIDLSEYYISVEWDIMRVPATRNEKFYSCCEEPYPDIIFNLTLRRKTLFYTVNLIIPCVGISFLSVLVFYLPSDSGEKISLCISILLSLTVFFLLLAEIIPPTSLTVPLLGKYLLFTMMLVTLSVVVTIVVLNVNFRSPVTHHMAPWVRKVFIDFLPKILCIRRPTGAEIIFFYARLLHTLKVDDLLGNFSSEVIIITNANPKNVMTECFFSNELCLSFAPLIARAFLPYFNVITVNSLIILAYRVTLVHKFLLLVFNSHKFSPIGSLLLTYRHFTTYNF
ncbi:acetylcholine receptor subunit alpha-like 1 isoform X2 [Hyposmocoma kahamanoa]|uniref:acetylcholine receptor subunit alpha-like 1 isoform X2 n=1 Tax=Hyposmocoma kahamanoa TaxID=1477025 RepID=UPI000E6D929D|nr:acetylcholine receptor subunit alpha-like 1 isoform X2 [Hyposmocoma kahamanoa]